MKATDFVRMSMEASRGWVFGLLEDMREAPLTQPTAAGGNHPLWVLGHLTYSESHLLDTLICGRDNRFPELESLFKNGTTPTADPSAYPTMDELMEKFATIRVASLAHLDTLTDDDLDRRSHAPEEAGPFFSTVGACYSAMALHITFHGGLVADARRAAGKQPLMA
ncbi:MAG: DinB family protein [Planctomycetota bacterium]